MRRVGLLTLLGALMLMLALRPPERLSTASMDPWCDDLRDPPEPLR